MLVAGCLQPKPATPPQPALPDAARGVPTPPVLPAAVDTEFSLYEESRFTIRFPADWAVEDIGAFTSFVSPAESGDDFRENVVVVVAELPSEAAGLSVEELIEASFDNYVQSIEGFKLAEASETALAGLPARKLVYAGRSRGEPLKYLQIVAVQDGTAYTVTYAGREEKYPALALIVEEMVRSFTLVESSTPELLGKWQVYAETVFYDTGERSWPDAPGKDLLELKANHTWNFGSATGTWAVQDLTDTDGARWATNLPGATRKLILYGWNEDLADGPLEEANGRVDSLWLLYRAGPPKLSRPGQVQMKFVGGGA